MNSLLYLLSLNHANALRIHCCYYFSLKRMNKNKNPCNDYKLWYWELTKQVFTIQIKAILKVKYVGIRQVSLYLILSLGDTCTHSRTHSQTRLHILCQ
ncbi:hypothetical protein EDC94DRAFT_269783 [Helicostylum pulchrum]|nr:hypothetical protein EDC94DRAFT_269783 [Helicostylum pulchrum]